MKVAVVNRQRGDRLSRFVGWLIYTALARRAAKRQSYADIQDVLAWVLPLYMLLLIIVWFGIVLAGFSLLIWTFRAEQSFLQAVISSGSALSTLGFLTPPNLAGQQLAIVEGAMGLGVVVFYFTFIPGYQTTIQLREAKVAWLYARAATGLTNFSLVEWFLLSGSNDWNALWEGWESWFRTMAETHALAPILAFVPTVQRGQTWLAAAAVALDSVSFYLSAIETRSASSAVVCHRTGVDALRLITAALSARPGAPEARNAQRLTRSSFDAACERFARLGAAIKPDRDACWLRFVELRAEYESALSDLAAGLLVPAHGSLLVPLKAADDKVLQ
ncbi:hypothetical protein [Paraburkholderia sp. JHI869]|uniref:hypothetical protein n=1 Tax=Paraburkholderia sp. JHI869 TaxID=3112959 RepID=UPI003173EE28